MERFAELSRSNPLFTGVGKEEFLPLLDCLQARKYSYKKGELIFLADSSVTKLGIVLSGCINTVYEDVLGGRSIIGYFVAGQLFCDAFACSTKQHLPVSIVAQVDSEVLLIEVKRILHTCEKSCAQHKMLAENLLHILADKYVALNRKMIHLSGRTTYRKLLSYLSEQMRLAGGNPFTIPFNRQELADYLFVDRTGLSVQWSNLKAQGILSEKNGLYSLNITPCDGADCAET